MHTILHKQRLLVKKLTITALLAVCGWFVHAGYPKDEPYVEQVKVVKFYPNPATSFINFEFTDNVDKTYILQVYSFVGKKIVEMPVSSSKILLTLNNEFYRGLYIFHLCDKSGKVIEVGKFQVVK